MRTRLLVFGYPLLEVATAYLVALWIGWGWMLLLLLAGIPIGFAVMRYAANASARDLVAASQTGGRPDAGRHALTFAGGVLILIPGFWSDLLGLLLVLPPTQRLFRSRARTWIEARVQTVRMPGAYYRQGDVIQGVVIDTEPDSPRPPADSRPPGQLGP